MENVMPTVKKKAPAKAKAEPKPKATPKPKAPAKPKAEPVDTREWLTVVCTSDSLTLTFPTKAARDDAAERLTVALGSTYRGQAIEVTAEEGTYRFADTQLCYLSWGR
tara:strand:- start:10369 stop:10692 length:324 start_codon:yes stop_codon:yes gene_type:complete